MSAYQNVSSDGTTVTLGLNGNPVIQYTTAGIQSGYGDNSIAPAKLTQPLTYGTAEATTSGTFKDRTGIPSWARRITVMFDGVSQSGTGFPWLQIGDSGGVETSGYVSTSTGNGAEASATGAFLLSWRSDSAQALRGSVVLDLLDPATNTWVLSGSLSVTSSAGASNAGSKSLTGTLDRIRITTHNGTDTFDAGMWNVAYE